ncbi:CinA family protein [uncultured Thalassolituus sp.]|mgnify:FL=1|jgi:nicotinamide-nucleotide amidase|uniref:CinA family protein n=1 Tax=uncultured Thalassolituus sp. TaxID=285273 RepID=UPI0026384D78|nr:CinA family protein [uncultured Thalassolituus sp.]
MSHNSDALCHALAEQLRARGWRLVTAESCTGGGIAAACTDLPGSSEWFECGFVTYSNKAKVRDLAVPQDVLDHHGAVSEETVRAMVAGALRYGDLAVAVSGIAGPGGAVPGKPVGTVWIAWGSAEGTEAQCYCFDGDRSNVRHMTIGTALKNLYEYLDK